MQQELLRQLHCLFSGPDACAEEHDCEHICMTNGDSYYCKCRTGYVLNADQKTCSRKDMAVVLSIQWCLCVKSVYQVVVHVLNQILHQECITLLSILLLLLPLLLLLLLIALCVFLYNWCQAELNWHRLTKKCAKHGHDWWVLKRPKFQLLAPWILFP